jgi:cell division protein FtsB
MRWITYTLGVLLLLLQYPLWFGGGSALTLLQLGREVSLQKEENSRLAERNQILGAEVINLKTGNEAIEERARTELGMIRKGETFFQVSD